jgi:hypothetical protein
MVRNVVRNSPPHHASSIYRLLEPTRCRKKYGHRELESHDLWLKISDTRATNSEVAFAGDPESNGG